MKFSYNNIIAYWNEEFFVRFELTVLICVRFPPTGTDINLFSIQQKRKMNNSILRSYEQAVKRNIQ